MAMAAFGAAGGMAGVGGMAEGVGSILNGIAALSQKQLGTESRSRTGTVFNRSFLDEVGRYIGQPLSLGELFGIGAEFVAGSPTLRQSMGLAPGGAEGYQAMRVDPASYDVGWSPSGPSRMSTFAAPRRPQLSKLSSLPGQGTMNAAPSQMMRAPSRSPLQNTGLGTLGIRPMRMGEVSTDTKRDTVPTTGGQDLGRLGFLVRRMQEAYAPKDTDMPESTGKTGIPEGRTRRYSMADLTHVWEYNDLDKLPDVERLFRKAKEKGMDVDINNFTLTQFQEMINKIGTIDPDLSARSKGNFSSALGYLNATARSEEGFGRGRGDYGPIR